MGDGNSIMSRTLVIVVQVAPANQVFPFGPQTMISAFILLDFGENNNFDSRSFEESRGLVRWLAMPSWRGTKHGDRVRDETAEDGYGRC